MNRTNWTWRTVDIVVAAAIAIAFGVVIWGWNQLWAAATPAFVAIPAAQNILYGMWLLPVNGDADGVTTEGLRFPLRDETLRFGRARGLSNEVASLPATVTVRKGSLLVFETPQGGG